jgi:hypothetical protein
MAEMERIRLKAEKRKAKRRAEHIEQLRMSVLQRYVVDGSAVEGVMTQKFVDIDGFGS